MLRRGFVMTLIVLLALALLAVCGAVGAHGVWKLLAVLPVMRRLRHLRRRLCYVSPERKARRVVIVVGVSMAVFVNLMLAAWLATVR